MVQRPSPSGQDHYADPLEWTIKDSSQNKESAGDTKNYGECGSGLVLC